MRHEELRTNEEYLWRAFFADQSTSLTLALEMILRCNLSSQQILAKTIKALEGSQQDS